MKNNSKLTNVLDTLAAGQKRLIDSNISSARLDSQVLLAHVLKQSKAWLLSHPEYYLSSHEQRHFEQLISKRAKNIPVAYLVGYKEFYGRNFSITPDVLVPRPETEQLIEYILTTAKKNDPLQILDLGTGSGILSITMALERPNWKIIATDISLPALRTAKTNAKLLAAQNVTFFTQDLLDNDSRVYDIIVTNLPYVPSSLQTKPDIAHEPPLALFAGEDGLDLYRKLFAQLASRQMPVPQIITESLQSQHATLLQIAFNHNYKLIATRQLMQHFSYGC